MRELKQFDDRILHLKKQKEQAETRLARALFKKISVIVGKDLDVSLITTILEDVWTRGNEKQKETWRQQAATFSGSGTSTSAKTTSQVGPHSEATSLPSAGPRDDNL